MTILSSIGDSASKLLARARTRGTREVAADLAGRVKGTLHLEDELLFLVRSAEWPGDAKLKSSEPFHLVRASERDGDDYERFVGTDSARTFAARLSNETDCWLVRGRGMVLHATWTTTGAAWTRELQRLFVPPKKSAYIYESFTRPEARGLGIYPFALVGIGRALAGDGVERLFVGVETGNAASVRAITKAGFEPAFTVSFRRHLGRSTIDEPVGPLANLGREGLRPRR